jgi:hypothetical protein
MAPQFAITRTEVRNPAEIVRFLLLKVVTLLLRVRANFRSVYGFILRREATVELRPAF